MSRLTTRAAALTWSVMTTAALLSACGPTALPVADSETTRPNQVANPDDRQPTFADEFDGAAGARPNPAVWLPDVGGTGWGNGELQYYTTGDNTYLDGQGHLVIEARAESGGHSCWYGPCRYTSGKLITRQSRQVAFTQQYGRFEARMKMPGETGLWPAFWMLGANIDTVGYPASGEIDVVETLSQRNREVQQHAHGPQLEFGSAYVLPEGQSVTDWHTYAVEWSPDAITWHVDGVPTRTLTRAEAGPDWVFDHPFYILLNLAVGGEWPGVPDASTVFPARMLVDYIRVYRTGNP